MKLNNCYLCGATHPSGEFKSTLLHVLALERGIAWHNTYTGGDSIICPLCVRGVAYFFDLNKVSVSLWYCLDSADVIRVSFYDRTSHEDSVELERSKILFYREIEEFME